MCKKASHGGPSVRIVPIEGDKVETFMQGEVASRTWTWDQPVFVGDCMLAAGAKLIVRSDGTANWIARARSTDDDDTFTAYFLFNKANGDPTFPTGVIFFPNRPFPVQNLDMGNDNTWYDWVSGFGFPAGSYNDMVTATGMFTC